MGVSLAGDAGRGEGNPKVKLGGQAGLAAPSGPA
jgi:hypothetical protein